jgi:hypothetical protein
MTLEYVKTKDQLPIDSDYECPICLDIIDIDESIDGVPNCVICSNGHRMHNVCLNTLHKRECTICRSIDLRFCKSILGYSYVPRKGGKKRKTYKKVKSHKKRNTKNNRSVKGKR